MGSSASSIKKNSRSGSAQRTQSFQEVAASQSVRRSEQAFSLSSKTDLCTDDKKKVLLLNASFEPLTAITVKRAIVLTLKERTEILHDDPDVFFNSARLQIQAPVVVRLLNFVKIPYKAHVPLTKTALLQRDGHRCVYCGAKADTIDHVIPRSRGGAHSWENCVASCSRCNHKKSDKLLSELGWEIKIKLEPPKEKYWRLFSSVKDIHPTWSQYLHHSAA